MNDSWRRPADEAAGPSFAHLKQCCAAAYGNDSLRLLVGDTLHPGGAQLTGRLGQILHLGPRSRVLDVAAGRGASALALAARFGCEVVGLDYSRRNVELATLEAARNHLGNKLTFYCGDAEQLPFADGRFDAIICECALCTFPSKDAAAAEFARVLRPGGRVGMSDLTRRGSLPGELESLAAWIACVADAQPLENYCALLAGAGLNVGVTEEHDRALTEFIEGVRSRLLAAEIMVGLKKVELPGIDLALAKDLVRHALVAAKAGKLGYAMVTATKDGNG